MSRHRAGKRPWLAAALAVVYPGLGHLYLRKWLRALAWFLLVFATTALTLPQSALPESGALSVDAVLAASRALSVEASLAILVLTILSMLDAYRIARRRASSTGSGVQNPMGRSPDAAVPEGGGDARVDHETPSRCPSCGRETGTEFDFCQWCGEPLDPDSA